MKMVSGRAVSPRRRRIRPRWNLEHQQDLPDGSLSPQTQRKSFSSEQSTLPVMPQSPLASNKGEQTIFASPLKIRKLLVLFVLAMCLLLALLNANAKTILSTGDVIRGLEVTDDTHVGVRRRLIAPGVFHKNKNDKELRYLSFGGPLTYGRGLDKIQRNSQAYPYLLATKVHNIADPTYNINDPTMASLCTQSIVQDAEDSTSSSTEYDVITLEYSFASSERTKEAYISSMELLVHRLRQRYPRAEIILVEIWNPSDLVHFDAESNRLVSYEEWKRHQQNHVVSNNASFEWTHRSFSLTELEVEDELKAMMASVGGFVAQLPLPEIVNEILIDDWFREDTETNTGALSLVRHTLSKKGHDAVAKAIRDALRAHRTGLPRIVAHSPYLYSWGSGDSCKLWYDTQSSLPDPSDYSTGLLPSEIAPDSYALEVTSHEGGTLQVHNPFNTDKLVYLTYLTASEMTTSNKVYPRIKVKMAIAASETTTEQQLSPATSILIDPSHTMTEQHQLHYTRTSAVGVLPAHQTSTLEFTTLEEYTIHPFRILGVSILHHETNRNKKSHVPFEFTMFAPRKLPVDKGSADEDFDDDDMEDGEEAKPQ